MRILLLMLLISVVTVAGVAGQQIASGPPAIAADGGGRLPLLGEGGIEASRADFTGDLIPVLERDAIPSLDFPPIAASQSASIALLNPEDQVIGVVIGDQARAYPLRLLAPHEIVNDVLNDVPIVVTFCPLCYSGVVYDRRVAGETRTFGVSGVLLNSNLVLYDRERESLWAQVTGAAVGGPDRGWQLKRVAFTQTTWSMWLGSHSETTVPDMLALGGLERYPADRFASYYGSGKRGLVPLRSRPDVEPKALVLGIVEAGRPYAWPLEPLAGAVLTASINQRQYVIVVDNEGQSGRAFRLSAPPAGLTLVRDPADARALIEPVSGQRWSAVDGAGLDGQAGLELADSTVSFWFAWSAFYPQTTLHKEN